MAWHMRVDSAVPLQPTSASLKDSPDEHAQQLILSTPGQGMGQALCCQLQACFDGRSGQDQHNDVAVHATKLSRRTACGTSGGWT